MPPTEANAAGSADEAPRAGDLDSSTLGRCTDAEKIAGPDNDFDPSARSDTDNRITSDNAVDAITAKDLDVDSNETDSAFGDVTTVSVDSSTISLSSSLYQSVEENGRTYHRYKEGKYFLPNDKIEQNRLDLQHHLFLLTLRGDLYLAPIKRGINYALDIATGTGIWAIEFANQFPQAKVIGTDLSPIQPSYVPRNCVFEVDDAEDEWIYPHKFDYIHGRLLLSCFKDFPAVVSKAFDALKPGGYLELQDMLSPTCLDQSWNGSDMQRWVTLCIAGGNALGMDWLKVERYRQYMETVGFVDIREVDFAWPSNTWPKAAHHKLLGAWQNQNLLRGAEGISLATLTRGLGMKKEEVNKLLIGVKRDICDRNIHCYTPIRVIYGRKPT